MDLFFGNFFSRKKEKGLKADRSISRAREKTLSALIAFESQRNGNHVEKKETYSFSIITLIVYLVSLSRP